MLQKDNIKVGDKVYYQPLHFPKDEFENGMVKELTNSELYVRVVYKCNNEWDRFMEYTSQLTAIVDLYPGWLIKVGEEL